MAYSSTSESSESNSISSNNWRTESSGDEECLGDCDEPEGIVPYRSEPTSSQSDVEGGGPGGENDYDDDVGMDIDRLQNTE